jgi:hypothetical protein
VPVDDGFANVESQADSGAIGLALVLAEQRRSERIGNRWSAVPDFDCDAAAALLRRYPNRATFRGELDGVVHQVRHQTFDHAGINDGHGKLRAQIQDDPDALDLRLMRLHLHDPSHQRVYIDPTRPV